MDKDNGKSKINARTPCGCSRGWFKTRLTLDQDLIVYTQPLHHVHGKSNTRDHEEKAVVSAFVFQRIGGNDVSIQTEALLPEFDVNEINCPRCQHYVQRARALLRNVSVVKNNNVYVCEMCDLQRLTRIPCLHCENVRKKIKLNNFFASLKYDVLKQQENVFSKTVLGRPTMEKETKDFRAYSDILLTDSIERIIRHSQRVHRPTSALDSGYESNLKPKYKQAIGHEGEEKTSYRSMAKAINLKHESLVGLGTTGIMRRYHSEDSLRAISAKEGKIFKYIFPRMMKDGKFMFETSAEQLNDVRKRVQEDLEKRIKEQEEIKFKREIKKMIEWANQRGISLSDIDIDMKKGLKEKDIKNIIDQAKQKGITPSVIDIKTRKVQKEKDIKDVIEWAKQKGITIPKKNIRKTAQKGINDDNKLEKIKDFETRERKYEKKGGETFEKMKEGKRETENRQKKKTQEKKDLKSFEEEGMLGQFKKIRGKQKIGKDGDNELGSQKYDEKLNKKDRGKKGMQKIDKDGDNELRSQKYDKKLNEKDRGKKSGPKTGKDGDNELEIQKYDEKLNKKDRRKKSGQKIDKDGDNELRSKKYDKKSNEKDRGKKSGTKIGKDEDNELGSQKNDEKSNKKDRRKKSGQKIDKDGDNELRSQKYDKQSNEKDGEKKGRGKVLTNIDKEKKTEIKEDEEENKQLPENKLGKGKGLKYGMDAETASKENEQQILKDNVAQTRSTEAASDTEGSEKNHIQEDKTSKMKAKPAGKYIEGNSDIHISDENNTQKKDSSVKGTDPEKLLKKVLKKQDKYITVGNKAKKTQEEKLRSKKEKAKQTATQQTSIDDEKIVTNGGDSKQPGDNKTQFQVPLDTIKVDKNEDKDDFLMKMISERNKRKEKHEIKQIKNVELLPVPQRKPRIKETNEKEEIDSLLWESPRNPKPVREIIFGTEVMFVKDVPPEPEPTSVPVLFQTEFNKSDFEHTSKPTSPYLNDRDRKESTGAPFMYVLSDRKFIENGWTVLPTEKMVRKVNVYRMHPAYPEFDWFNHNKKKGSMQYSSGEKLAEIDESGRGRLYYKNGRLALNYYDCEELNAKQRYVVYSSGEPDERGRSTPITVLGIFDHMGNGVVFDHSGKIRLKYNQNEGIVLDRSIGPVSQWKWHSLNDPPDIQQIMVDSQLESKDPTIFSYDADHLPTPQDESLLALEYDNLIKSKAMIKEFKPNQINMKTIKLNGQFTLKIQDQNRIYLLFRDGATSMKVNLGLNIDHNEIVDTTYCELGDICTPAEKSPAATQSLADLQSCLKEAQKWNQVRVARGLNRAPLIATLSADRMTAAASKPLRRPLLTNDPNNKTHLASPSNTYHNTRLI